MKYCTECGNQIAGGVKFCPYCGNDVTASSKNDNNSLRANSINDNDRVNVNVHHRYDNVDAGSDGYCVLGFCFPFIGLILYLIWKDTQPRNASKIVTGALISTAILGAIYLLFVLSGFYY